MYQGEKYKKYVSDLKIGIQIYNDFFDDVFAKANKENKHNIVVTAHSMIIRDGLAKILSENKEYAKNYFITTDAEVRKEWSQLSGGRMKMLNTKRKLKNGAILKFEVE